MEEVQINKGYELYQIITDFGDPLEIFREAFQNSYDAEATKVFCRVYQKDRISGSDLIIDIWDNGNGLSRDKVSCFFDLANSTKIDENKIQIKGKLGYKGHGSKIFFNSKCVQICSKRNNDYWAIQLDEPLSQIEKKETFYYSEFCKPDKLNISLPNEWNSGFMLRIIGHKQFNTQHTKFKLNHMNLRDYIKWYTVFGTIRTLNDKDLANKNITLYLSGLEISNFEHDYSDPQKIDPKPQFANIEDTKYEIIQLGHYFPEPRYSESEMKKYARKIKSSKPYYEYYNRLIYNENVSCGNNVNFRFIINIEGYETKRLYDILLTKRGKSRTEITHTDSDRYGIWACKGGIPVEKIDDWVEGGKGTYSFMQAFVDCDDFQLTANRGSVRNSDIEKIQIIKEAINNILNNKKIKDLIQERSDIEKLETQISSIEEDGKSLNDRYSYSKKSRYIYLPNGITLKEPTKLKSGYSESETFSLFISLTTIFPDLFPFTLLDYNTTKGIDCVVDVQGYPKYIEFKGTMHNKINHPFRYIYKFICYDMEFLRSDIISDIEEFKTKLQINKDDKFNSFDENFKGKSYTSYQLVPDSASLQSMEIYNLKEILTRVLNASIK